PGRRARAAGAAGGAERVDGAGGGVPGGAGRRAGEGRGGAAEGAVGGGPVRAESAGRRPRAEADGVAQGGPGGDRVLRRLTGSPLPPLLPLGRLPLPLEQFPQREAESGEHVAAVE